MKKLFLTLLCTLMVLGICQKSFAQAPIRAFSTMITIEHDSTKTDSIIFSNYSINGYFDVTAFAFPNVSGDTLDENDSVSGVWYRKMYNRKIEYSGVDYGAWHTDDNADSTVIFSNIGLDDYTLGTSWPMTTITPGVCQGLEIGATFSGDSADVIDLILILLVH
jgi:hypothetical protein